MILPDVPPLSWFDYPQVRAFYRACYEASLTYLYAPHDEAERVRIEFVDEPLRPAVTARQFARRYEVPDEAVLRAASIGVACAGHRIRKIQGRRVPMLRGWVCNSAGGRYRSCTEAAAAVGCHNSTVRQCCRGTFATAGGLRWWREVNGRCVTPRVKEPKSPRILYKGQEYRSIKKAAQQLGRYGVTRRMIETKCERLAV
jgi:hypothetical protein